MTNADLHFHSLHSDGKHRVDWLAEQLKASGVKLAVLSDHDGVEGFAEYREATKALFPSVCASELSCTYETASGEAKELHLLVYGIDPEDADYLAKFKTFREEREKRFLRICERLSQAGYPVDGEAIMREHGGVLGRPHVADAMVKAGYASSRVDAFDRFLKEGKPYVVAKWRFPLKDAVALAKQKGCKTSIAHPGQYHFNEEILREFRDLGVDAIEVYHPRHSPSDRLRYNELARRLGYGVTGGSDFHSFDSDQILGKPSLGRTDYPYDLAKSFLGDLI